VIMTTNHKEVLDPALTRPGRVDFECELGHCTREMAKQFFLNFYPQQEELAQTFIEDFPDKHSSNSVSPASMQQFFQRKEHKVDLDKRHDLEHEHEKASVAVANRHRFNDPNESKQESEELIWDHLKRIGLEQYASLFESYGFFTKNSCLEAGALSVAEFEKWCKDPSLEIAYDKKAQEAIKQWLDPKNPQRSVFEDNYTLVSKHKVMSMLQATFPKEIPPQKEVHECLKETHELQSMDSDSSSPDLLVRTSSRTQETWALLAKQTVQELILIQDGKSVGKVSNFEFKRHLRFNNTSLSEAVDKLPSLMQSRPESDILQPLKFVDFLARIGCKGAIHALKDVRVAEMKDLTAEKSEANIDSAQISAEQKSKIKAYSKPDGLSARQLDDFSILDVVRVRNLLQSSYPNMSAACTRGWVAALTHRGPVSVLQLKDHIQEYKDAAVALEKIDKMHEVPEKKVEEPPPPLEGWIVDWLSDDEELKDYAPNFVGQKICTKEDVVAEPPIDCATLKAELGIDKLGHQKKILKKIEELRQDPEQLPQKSAKKK